MNQLWVRPFLAKKKQQFLEWLHANREKNLYDPGIFSYGQTRIYDAYGKDGSVLFVPVQKVFVLDSLAPKPEATERQVAHGLREVLHTLVTKASEEGIGEIYFAAEPSVAEFASHYGFVEVDRKIMKLKISDLDKEQCV
jgi:hypothetical protein